MSSHAHDDMCRTHHIVATVEAGTSNERVTHEGLAGPQPADHGQKTNSDRPHRQRAAGPTAKAPFMVFSM